MSVEKANCCRPCLNLPFVNVAAKICCSTQVMVEPLKLKTVDCDWMQKENEKEHHTNEFANMTMVLRRGQTFKVKMTFQRAFHKQADKISLDLCLGTKSVNQNKLKCPLMDSLDKEKWGMVITHESDDGLVVTFDVFSPPTASIGRYKTTVVLTSHLQSGEIKTTTDQEPDFILLFNPWAKEDVVFINDAEMRKEYCLNDIGIIYRGSSSWLSPKKWNFGQFEKHILECSLSLLDKDKRVQKNPNKWIQKKGDPVWVSRIVSAMVNAQDDNGVLVGNWSGDYSAGIAPTKWNGSVEILQQFYNTGKSVCYGQCWVFSGLVTTVLRCLGIPTRSVTNFSSAHDTDSSMTIDNFIDENGDEVELGGDSVWNFHVWNECWMKRKDLPDGYDGWQAVDATPQEVSLGLYQTGPAPLTAIKNGEVYVGFETGFVFAEVNADRVNWIVEKEDDGYSVVGLGSRYSKAVGKSISTKAVGKDERHDVTNLYKAPEGSEEERLAFQKAYGFGNIPEYQKGFLGVEKEGKGLTLDFKPSSEILKNGDGFSITIEMKNDTDKKATVDLSCVLHSTLYTGKKKNFIKRQRFSAIPVDANSKILKEFAVTYSDYETKLVDLNSLRLQVVARVKETKKMFSDLYEFRLENKDSIEIDVEKKLKIGTDYDVTINFTNPYPTRLTNVVVTIEGPGMAEPAVKKLNRPIAPGGATQVKFSIRPKRPGPRSILVDIDTKQIKDLKSFVDVSVA